MKIFRYMVTLSVILLSSTLLFTNSPAKEPAAESSAVKWLTFEEAVALNEKKPRKIFIDVYTSWCGWCKVMDKQTFSDPIVAEYLNTTYYPVKLNAERRDTIVFQGKTYVFVPTSRRGYHELAAELMQGRMSYPTVVIMDENSKGLQAIPGFRKPPELDVILKYYGGNHHRKTDYQTFSTNYKSPFSN